MDTTDLKILDLLQQDARMTNADIAEQVRLTAFIRLTVAYDKRQAAGVAALRDDPDVLECYSVAGEDCYIIKTRVGSPTELEALIHRIRSRLTVLRSVTMIALSAIKEGGALSTNESV